MELVSNFYIIKIRTPYLKNDRTGTMKAYIAVTKFAATKYLLKDTGVVVGEGKSLGPLKRRAEELDRLYARMDSSQQEQHDLF